MLVLSYIALLDVLEAMHHYGATFDMGLISSFESVFRRVGNINHPSESSAVDICSFKKYLIIRLVPSLHTYLCIYIIY